MDIEKEAKYIIMEKFNMSNMSGSFPTKHLEPTAGYPGLDLWAWT